MRNALALLFLALIAFTGCGKGQGSKATTKKILSTDTSAFPVTVTNPKTGKTWTILGIMTDGHDFGQAKAHAEDTLTKHDDLVAMVGLWAYNPPKILQAVRADKRTDKPQIIGFDEDPDTLNAIATGEVAGTVVQNPYGFGYKSVEYLAALVRGQPVKIPEDKLIFVPTRLITRDTVGAFKADIRNKRTGKGPDLPADRDDYDTTERVKVTFITNSVDPFWELAQQGCRKAAAKFNVDVSILMPPNGKVEEQKQYIEEEITKGTQALAISPIDPANQGEMIDAAAAKIKVITQDSDAPKTKRLFYIGTDNYAAGRQAGELVAKVCPNGGKVAIFVGKMEVLNAQERSQGVIDVLLGQ